MADDRFSHPVGAFADLAVADDALFVDHDNRWPGPDFVALPIVEVIVLHDGKFDAQPGDCLSDFVERLFPGKFRRMDTDNRQPQGMVLIMPRPQLRDDVATIDSPVGPKFDQDHSTLQTGYGERFAIEPVDAGKLRSLLARSNAQARFWPEQPSRRAYPDENP